MFSMIKVYVLCFVSFLVLMTCHGGLVKRDVRITKEDKPLNPDELPYFSQLDKDFELRWDFNSTNIIFQTRVKTKGYIGLGISDHGSMFPSDLIIAWVKDNGKVHFKDRHATGYYLPPEDISQDWHLISGSREDDYTTITMMRLLDTCDREDIAITGGTTRLIYSYSSVDPTSDNSIAYHGMNRGAKSILLLDPQVNENKAVNLPDDVIAVDFLNKNYSVPATDTTYSCQAHKLPPLTGKHHMIRYEPYIQEGHEKLVHHMILYFCNPRKPIGDDLSDYRYNCYEYGMPKEFYACEHVLIGWAMGGTAFDFPPHVGYSLGEPDDPIYFLLETHYDNPGMRNDFVDSSGIRIIVTEKLRENDAGVLEVGVHIDKYQMIPPYSDSFLSRGICYEGCIADAIGDDEIYIFADTLHSHLLGKKMTTRHIRDGVELAPIMEDNNYDFNYQENRLLKEERVVKKGDTIITDCYYDSSRKTEMTYGGLSTREEMCISFLLYYPKTTLSTCRSRVRYDIDDESKIFDIASKMDFKNETVRHEFADMINRNDLVYNCLTFDSYEFGWDHQPQITHPFSRKDQCKN